MQDYSWKSIFSALIEGEDLSKNACKWAMSEIMSGNATETQIAGFMLGLRTKGETSQELGGLVDVMLENAAPLQVSDDALDIVGTGGDLVGTVNISSMASIVARASGIPVLKHGSRSASGKTGSSEMLEKLGINLELNPQQVAQVFQEQGITFFFAPVFHPAMRHVAKARKELGVPTTFNFLGPLANPAQPLATALGVADLEIAPLMAQELAQRGRTALVFRSNDGLDELSTTAPNTLWQVAEGTVQQFELDAQDIGVARATQDQLLGGDAAHNAKIAIDLFEGREFPNSAAISDIVCLNAAVGIVAYQLANDPKQQSEPLESRLKAGFVAAKAAIASGAAKLVADDWANATKAL
ncbi:anthranilate phosphoribosyltransferase [Aquiluna sp.]|jgi:anthranilate phosphoribosyltransferase|nr:anthranilate phosphoribosyltransferase [Aquiluna sp.]